MTSQTSSRGSAVTAQLQTCLATVAQLESENQQIKTQISDIIHEITDTPFILDTESPNPEWCSILSFGAEARILQSSYDELRGRHSEYSGREITQDLYTKMIQKHGFLWKQYKKMLRSHAVLEDDLQRLTRQLANPLDVCASKLFAVLAGLTTPADQRCSLPNLP